MAAQTKDSYYLSLKRDDARHRWRNLIKEFPEQLVDRPMTKVELEHAQRTNPEIPVDVEEVHDLAFGIHKEALKSRNSGRKGEEKRSFFSPVTAGSPGEEVSQSMPSSELSEEEVARLSQIRDRVQTGNNPELSTGARPEQLSELSVPLYESPMNRLAAPASREDVDSSGGSASSQSAPSSSATEEPALPSRPRTIRRPSLRPRRKTRGLLERFFKFDSRRMLQQAATTAGRFLFSTPTGWVVLGVIFIFCIIIYMVVLRPSLSGGPDGSQVGPPGEPIPGQPTPGSPIPGLEISTSGPSYVLLGTQLVTYEINVNYSGPLDVLVYASVPAGTTYRGSSPEGKIDKANNAIQWNLRSFPSDNGSYKFFVRLSPFIGTTQITFKASAIAGPQAPEIGN